MFETQSTEATGRVYKEQKQIQSNKIKYIYKTFCVYKYKLHDIIPT